MAEKVLDEVRAERFILRFGILTAHLHGFSGARFFSQSLATDGTKLFFPPEHLLEVWRKNPVFINRSYLHALLHCIFLHLWTRGGREKVFWDTACDIVVEGVIDGLNDPAFKRPVSWTRQKPLNCGRNRGLYLLHRSITGWSSCRKMNLQHCAGSIIPTITATGRMTAAGGESFCR